MKARELKSIYTRATTYESWIIDSLDGISGNMSPMAHMSYRASIIRRTMRKTLWQSLYHEIRYRKFLKLIKYPSVFKTICHSDYIGSKSLIRLYYEFEIAIEKDEFKCKTAVDCQFKIPNY